MNILRTEGLGITFGGVVAVQNLDLQVEQGRIHAIIGPNGAGKSTVFNLITRRYDPNNGRIFLDDRDITGLAPHRVVELGIARTFQNIRLFSSMTVLENVLMGYHSKLSGPLWRVFARSRGLLEGERRAREAALHALESVGLGDKANRYPRNLPYGEQKLIEVARGLISDPKILLLDEPVAGLNSAEKERMAEFLKTIKSWGKTMLLIEHSMRTVMKVADQITVLHHGQKLAEGTPAEIQENPEVLSAYLGQNKGWKT